MLFRSFTAFAVLISASYCYLQHKSFINNGTNTENEDILNRDCLSNTKQHSKYNLVAVVSLRAKDVFVYARSFHTVQTISIVRVRLLCGTENCTPNSLCKVEGNIIQE